MVFLIYVFINRTRYRKYKALYKKSLAQPDYESTKTKLAELEEGLDVASIVMAREQAKLEVGMVIVYHYLCVGGYSVLLGKTT